MTILKDKRVITAIVALIAAIAAYFGVDLPQNELTATLTAGDSAGALSLIVGVVIGALGGYGAGAVRNKPK